MELSIEQVLNDRCLGDKGFYHMGACVVQTRRIRDDDEDAQRKRRREFIDQWFDSRSPIISAEDWIEWRQTDGHRL